MAIYLSVIVSIFSSEIESRKKGETDSIYLGVGE